MDPVTNQTVFVIPVSLNTARRSDDRIEIIPGRTSFSILSKLVIKSLNETDHGQYYCVGKPKFDARIKLPMMLTVKGNDYIEK